MVEMWEPVRWNIFESLVLKQFCAQRTCQTTGFEDYFMLFGGTSLSLATSFIVLESILEAFIDEQPKELLSLRHFFSDTGKKSSA